MTTNDFFFKDTYQRMGPPVVLAAQFQSFAPTLTAKDFELGEITRYFAQQTNQKDGDIVEVAKQTFDGLQNLSLYRTVALRWQITGFANDVRDLKGRLVKPSVETANKASIKNASKIIPNIGNKLTNPMQLWRGF